MPAPRKRAIIGVDRPESPRCRSSNTTCGRDREHLGLDLGERRHLHDVARRCRARAARTPAEWARNSWSSTRATLVVIDSCRVLVGISETVIGRSATRDRRGGATSARARELRIAERARQHGDGRHGQHERRAPAGAFLDPEIAALRRARCCARCGGRGRCPSRSVHASPRSPRAKIVSRCARRDARGPGRRRRISAKSSLPAHDHVDAEIGERGDARSSADACTTWATSSDRPTACRSAGMSHDTTQPAATHTVSIGSSTSRTQNVSASGVAGRSSTSARRRWISATSARESTACAGSPLAPVRTCGRRPRAR